jgi:hypothetical protein
MKKILLPIMVVVMLAMFAPVMATANTKVMLVEDAAPGGIGVIDMIGPTGFGFVNFNQDAKYDLRVTISLKNAQCDTEYVIFLVAGPTHAQAMGYISIGTLTTNEVGNGNQEIQVPLSTLQAYPFGSGGRTDHIDMLKGVGDASAGCYVAAGINYFVP